MRIRWAVAVTAILVGACSASPSNPPTESAPTSSPTTVSGEPAAPGTTSAPVGDAQAVAEAFFESPALTENEQQALIEEKMVACMAEAGFEYVPVPPVEVPITYSTIADAADRAEFMAEYGYGVTTLFLETERAAALAAASNTDPNEAVRATMSEAELAAYWDVLWGPVISSDEPMTEDGSEMRDNDAGCRGQALRELQGYDRRLLSEDLTQAMDDMWKRLFADPRVIEADTAWLECMREAGYDADVTPGIRPTGDGLVRSIMDGLLATASFETEILNTDDGAEVPVELPRFDEAALAQAQQQELDIAVTDLDCDDEAQRTTTVDNVRQELEDDLMDRYLPELADALVHRPDP